MTSRAVAAAPSSSRMGDVLTLTKVRVNSLVVATTAGGYVMGATGGIRGVAIAAACAGTALVAAGAAALNQISERDVDRLMVRTRHRPVADQRMSVAWATTVALASTIAGLGVLWSQCGPLSAVVALVTFASYAFVYTPLKRVTSLSTIVGAVPGALPPLIGWAAARGSLAEPGAWALFLIGFVWQLPHILAVGWMYREDYARAGLPVLAVVDATGAMSGRQSLVWAAALIPISLLPSALHLTGLVYLIGALGLGVAQFAMAVVFARDRSRANASRLFYATLTYLPLLWLLMITTRLRA
jgi:protoheme IX farnesyltransferase